MSKTQEVSNNAIQGATWMLTKANMGHRVDLVNVLAADIQSMMTDEMLLSTDAVRILIHRIGGLQNLDSYSKTLLVGVR